MIEIFPTRAGYECSDGTCDQLDCCRCHPEVEKVVVERPPEPETPDGEPVTDGVY